MAKEEQTAGGELDHLLNHYIMIMRAERGLAFNTLEAYRRDLGKFQRYCKQENLKDPKELTTQSVLGFLDSALAQAMVEATKNVDGIRSHAVAGFAPWKGARGVA